MNDNKESKESEQLYADVTQEVGSDLEEAVSTEFAKFLVENSPFGSEEWTENNGRPREW